MPSMVHKSIVVTGTPGTGKTTLCRRISKITDFTHIDLGRYVVRNSLYVGYDENRSTYVVDTESTKSALSKILKNTEKGYLFDGSFAHLVVPPRMVLGAVVLRTHPLEIIERLSKRSSVSKSLENAQAEALDIILGETVSIFKRVYEIDTTNRLVNEVVQEFLTSYKRGLPSKIGTIHWLERLHESGNIEKIFARDF